MPAKPLPAQGLYAITRDGPEDIDALCLAVAAALRGGAVLVQYRAKSAPDPTAAAERLLALCRAAGVPLIINDSVELAAQTGADGVHLGRDDPSPQAARRRLGDGAIIGVSCYDSVALALAAEAAGADYAAFGRFFPSRTKPGAPLARLDTLIEARRRLHIPLAAIGGITPDNAAPLLEAGAGLLAVVEGVFGGDDPAAAARRFAPLFEPGRGGPT
ncbi:thiamine-phosphate pyrophosphorylase [Methylomagnum ishizawai]|uniref:Thiamine-phosphate synthase n=1 Tax=Methylomagnum ishizawai TaxID=1760988 RepID=A0A1Y6D1M7_9GAMM|nr:thiamine phosphate synthase [Methylomagnum ishizawai]SMF94753.1 thiamine-phosphate pyrophosphorylase [Methylomagnum ishizawai]